MLHAAIWTTDLWPWEFPLRAVVVYAFLLVLLRLTGKRQVGQMDPFDLVLLLVLSNAVQNSMNGGDNSITGGLILATTLVGLNWLVAFATFLSKKLELLIEGQPIVLIHNGHINSRAMRSAQLTHHELESSLRAAGCCGPHDVRFAVLENNGSITVIPRKEQENETKKSV